MQVRLSPEAALLLTILRRELDRCLMRHVNKIAWRRRQ